MHLQKNVMTLRHALFPAHIVLGLLLAPQAHSASTTVYAYARAQDTCRTVAECNTTPTPAIIQVTDQRTDPQGAGSSTEVDAVARLTYPKLVAIAGGEEAIRRNVREMSQEFQRLGMSIESREFPEPPTIIITADRSYAIVPTHIIFVAGDNRAESYGFQFGVREQGAATWTYLEGTKINAELLEAWFPDFPADYPFPRVSREKL